MRKICENQKKVVTLTPFLNRYSIMKRILIVISLLIFIGNVAKSQQGPQFTHNMFNNMFINPAFAGSNDAICATSLLRQQWLGVKEDGNNVSPRTMLISLDAPVNLIHGGLGATIYQDQLGYSKDLGVNLSYAYRINMGEGKLSFGAMVGFLNKSIDFSKLKPIEEGDELLTSKSTEKNFMTDFGFGVFYKVPDKMFIGFSSTQLSQASKVIGSKADYQLKRHYYLTGGYEYTLPNNPEFEIDPSFLIKTDGASAQYELNGLLRYNNKFWGGVTYRVQDAFAILLGMHYKNFRIGYAYDITTSKMVKAGSGGSHEIMLGYCFKIIIEKPRKSYRNTRFL